MKMKKIFTCLAVLLCTSYAAADEITIPGVTVPAGGSEEFVVNFATDGPRVGFTFALDLPEGFSIPMSEGMPVMVTYPCISQLNPIFTRQKEGETLLPGHNFGGQPKTSESVITSNQGTLLMIAFDVASTVTPGTYEIPVSKVTFQYSEGGSVKDQVISDFIVPVTVVAADANQVILRETELTAPAPANNVNVTVKRTFKANTWSTFCLPVVVDASTEAAMTKEQALDIFGADAKFACFDADLGYTVNKDASDNITEIIINFFEDDLSEGFTANYPYIVFPTKAVTEFTLDNAKVVIADPEITYKVGKTTKGKCIGTYVAGTKVPSGDLFISDNKFWYSTGNSVMKAFRCYFHLADQFPLPSTARVTFTVDGDPTAIEDIQLPEGVEMGVGEVYDLQGRRVNNPHKGLYIQNGKKVFIK